MSNRKWYERVEVWFAGALLVFFFLPWLSIAGLINSTGYQVPDLANLLQQGTRLLNPGGNSSNAAAYLVYVVPALAVATLVMAFVGRDTRVVGIITGVAAIIVFGLLWSNLIVDRSRPGIQTQFLTVGIGAYLTALAAVGIILASLGVIRLPQRREA